MNECTVVLGLIILAVIIVMYNSSSVNKPYMNNRQYGGKSCYTTEGAHVVLRPNPNPKKVFFVQYYK